jgi:oligosaccharyltransferase complex subunit alpha (ribophorin I)
MKLSQLASICSVLAGSFCVADSNLTTSQSSQQLLRGDFRPPQVFKNVNLVRNTNLDKGYVRETVNVVIENVDKQPQSEYYLPFEYDVIAKVGGMEVRDKKNTEKGRFDVQLAATSEELGDDGTSSKCVTSDRKVSPLMACRSTQYYITRFPEPLQPKAQLTLAISYHFLSSLTPLPATIRQDETQYLTYTFSAYVPSVYPTLKQKTKLKLPTTDVPEYTTTTGLKSGSDPEKQGTSFTYGPYETEKVPPGTTHPVSIRYEFTKPILACSLLERDLEVSHWGGNLATEERYWLRNDAATLSDNFSRVKWATQSYYNGPTSALKELKVPLKPGSVDPYFTDDIGNVSTSRYRPNRLRDASLELKPRYPVFGGWKYSFRIGWNNRLGSFLRKLKIGNSYALSVPFMEGPKMPEGIQYDHVQIRVILPEGATNVKWELVGGSGMPALRSEISLHKTFMDTVGRTELKLKAVNVVDEAREASLVIIYEYPFLAAFRKPLSIFVGVFGVFVAAWAIGRVDTSIGRK